MSSCWQQGCYRNFTYKTWAGVCHQRENRGERERERDRQRERGGCVEYSLERHQRWSHLQHNVNAMFYFFSSIRHPGCCNPPWKHHILLQGLAEIFLRKVFFTFQYSMSWILSYTHNFLLRYYEQNWTINYTYYPSAEHPLLSVCLCVLQIITLENSLLLFYREQCQGTYCIVEMPCTY